MRFEIVSTDEAIARGLSGRAEIPADYGMLFMFERHGRHGFWMKGMLTAIDILWLDDDGTVRGVAERVSPATFPKMFYPPTPVRLVLETRAGEARAKGWTVGAKVPLPDGV
jgi:uncharacterized membrane protein (UPF0127 family)